MQKACVYDSGRGRRGRLRYLLYRPRGFRAGGSGRWPLVVFLHGAGERGGDLEAVKRHGIPRVVEDRGGLPFVAVSPQCPAGSYWRLHLPALEGLVAEVVAEYAVDTDRIVLTGISMGGFGTWGLAARCPDRFAALVPVCGGGFASQGFPGRVRDLRHVPVWAFHGAKDRVVPPEESRRMVDALRACGGEARLTIYPDLGHDCWTRAYGEPELYEWMMARRRRQPTGEE